MSTRRRLFLSAPLIPIATLALWGGPVFAGDPAAAIVKLKDIKFTPGRVVISPGQSVTWEFLDADILTSHNVTSVGRLRFHSSPTMRSGSYTIKFDRSGTYKFMCTIHPASMNGEVIVR
jgi:plastocyanin